MITKIEALNYRALRYISQPLLPFQVLIGPNASGKTTFLDVIALLAEAVASPNIAEAFQQRTPDFRDMTWMRQGEWFEFAIEADVPEDIQSKFRHLRYEVRLGVHPDTGEIAWLFETLWGITEKKSFVESKPHQFRMFPGVVRVPDRITGIRVPNNNWKRIITKSEQGNNSFYDETTKYKTSFKLGFRRSGLGGLPEDNEKFPAALWFSELISSQVQRIMLNSEALRRPSPPQSPRTFLPDGSNLPRIVYELEQRHPDALQDWIEHVQTALPDLRGIRTVERPEDRSRYLLIAYDSNVEIPSWTASDGTLRLLALTILAYLPEMRGIYLIEEPENGIHPRAVETVIQSLSSVYDAQVLLATHSPVVLTMVNPAQILCFARTEEGTTDIISGNLHPRLENWQGEVSLSTLFASGVLG
jgi:predicted ATPase